MSMFTITKQFKFEAAHHLPHLPADHKCRRPHGHSYRVEVVAESEELDDRGFVVDYAAFDLFGKFLAENFDHRDLNEVLNVPTTAEWLARKLFAIAENIVPQTVEVRVSETQNTWAIYRPAQVSE